MREQSFSGTRLNSSAEGMAHAVAEYALELNEPPHIVDRALGRLIQSRATLTAHPVASGLLAREIAAMRESREPTEVESRLGRLLATFAPTSAEPAASSRS